MYISYSGHKSYKDCPRQYWHRYIDKTKLEAPENKVNSLYGSTIGTLFEFFYNERIWLQKGVADLLEARVDPLLDDLIARESKQGVIDWADPKANYKTRKALRKDVAESIGRGIAIIRHYRFLGLDAAAEVILDSTIEGHKIGGRADFIMTRVKPHGDLIILDGKGSKHREKYVDPQQLWWYAMLYRHQHKSLPDRLAFLFWRQLPESAVDWIPFSTSSLDALLTGVLNNVNGIEENKRRLSLLQGAEFSDALNELFPAFIGDKCRLCAYQAVCTEGGSHVGRRTSPPAYEFGGVEDVSF